MNRFKNKFFFVGLLLLSLQAFSQKPYFIYFQTEDNSPFFVQHNKKNYSSSGIGHLILSGLTNGTYTILVGFTGQNTMQEYQLLVENKDQGFLVKKMEGDAGYGIVNLQTDAVQLSGTVKREAEEAEKQKALAVAEAKRIEDEKLAAETKRLEDEKLAAEAKRVEEEKAAAETKKLEDEKIAAAAVAAVAADSQKGGEEKVSKETSRKEVEKSAKETVDNKSTDDKNAGTSAAVVAGTAAVATVANNENKKEEKEIFENKKATDSAKTTTSITPAETTGIAPQSTGNPVAQAATPVVLTPAEIAVLQEEARRIDATGKRDSALAAEKAKAANTTAAPVFLDMDITMPGDSSATDSTNAEAAKLAALAAAANKDIQGNSSPTPVSIVAAGDSLVVVRDSVAVPVTAIPDTVDVSFVAKADSVAFASVSNPNCKAEATDADLELVSMIIKGERNPEDALEILKKTVKVKCINTTQLRKLTVLFAEDEYRYALLDLAYRYTSDRNNYSMLGDLLADTYYLNRFKAMLQ